MGVGWTERPRVIPLRSRGGLVWSFRTTPISPGESTKKQFGRTTAARPVRFLWFTLTLAVIFTWHSHAAPVSASECTPCASRRCFSFVPSFGVFYFRGREGQLNGITVLSHTLRHPHLAKSSGASRCSGHLSYITLHAAYALFWITAVPYQLMNLVTLHLVTYVTLTEKLAHIVICYD